MTDELALRCYMPSGEYRELNMFIA